MNTEVWVNKKLKTVKGEKGFGINYFLNYFTELFTNKRCRLDQKETSKMIIPIIVRLRILQLILK